MKELILIRHGKSSWDYPVSDKDRPLQERGINDAHLVSNTFKTTPIKIDCCFFQPCQQSITHLHDRSPDFEFPTWQL